MQQPVAAVAPVAAPAPVAPAAPEVPAAPTETRFLTVLLAALAESWPEPLRHEINAQNLSAKSVGLPMGVIEGAIKQGKVAFPWKAVRSWIKPPVAESVSPHDATLVELPLKAITPLFLAELKSTRAQKKISMDENIPDLFSDARQSDLNAPAPAPATVRPPAAPAPVRPPAPVAAPVPAAVPAYAAAPVHAPAASVAAPIPQEAPVFAFSAPGTPATITPAAPAAPVVQAQPAKTSDTNYYALQNGEEIPGENPLVFKKPGTPSTAFLNRYATPNEIVNKAASLQGVDGALIALPDGLLVASRIPSTMNADTIAAFLPQIFAKVSQCTRELRLGELNNLNFTVGNIPWKIFRVGSIYFAAFGRPGEAMPTGQLAGIAAELDRKAK
jgi:predicted regulator of Ras-like GTPase activity (Roadblock/LC7/MglB family)